MSLTDEQKIELAMEGFRIAKRMFIASMDAKEAEVREEIRKQIDDAGERFRTPYVDPLDGGDVGPV